MGEGMRAIEVVFCAVWRQFWADWKLYVLNFTLLTCGSGKKEEKKRFLGKKIDFF